MQLHRHHFYGNVFERSAASAQRELRESDHHGRRARRQQHGAGAGQRLVRHAAPRADARGPTARGEECRAAAPDEPRRPADQRKVPPAAYLSEDTDTPEIIAEENDWQAHQNSQLKFALRELDERSRDIIAKRWLAEKKTTLQDLAKEYEISAERIRQLENNAIKKLKLAVSST